VTETQVDGRLRFLRGLRQDGSVLTEEAVLRRLDQTPIAVVLGRDAAGQLDTQVTALTAVNLLARLFRRLTIVAPDGVDVDARLPFVEGPLGPALARFAGRVHADVRAAAGPAPADALSLHVADTASPSGPRDVYCRGTGWLARVSDQPVPLTAAADENPIGPLVAAALGVAEVFKRVFGDVLPRVMHAEKLAFSALTFQVGDEDPGPPVARLRLPDTMLVGAGSIGSAFLWGLAHVGRAVGRLTVVDPDALERHNPDRAILVLDDTAARGVEKAPWAVEAVQAWVPGVTMRPFVGTIRAYVDTLNPDYRLPLAISAVDSIESRRDIQDALPGAILNASTGPTNVEVSHHGALGERPCLYCLYLPDVLARSRVQVAMDRSGFGQKDVAEMLVPDSRRRLTPDNVRGIERHHGLAAGALQAYVGRRLAELLDDHLWYGQAPVQTDYGQALVTTAFVSALAGFLLLAETLKAADPTLAGHRLSGVYQQDLLGVPNGYVYAGDRDATGYCLCHSPLRRRLWREKYGGV
jgi:hypothetical protein